MPQRKRHRSDPRAVADAVRRYRAAATTAPPEGSGAVDMAALVDAWAAVIGRGPASVPLRQSRSGVLSVACRSASAAQTLAARADQLLHALNTHSGAHLRALRFVVADHVIPAVPTPTRVAPVTPSAQAQATAKGLVSGVDDDRLRALLERAAAVSIQRTWTQK